MRINKKFTVTALTSVLLLAGCGGDINVDTGGSDTPSNGGGNSSACDNYSFASEGTSINGNTVCVLDGSDGPFTASSIGSSTMSLGNNVLWQLSGTVVEVGGDNDDSVVLDIEPGTTIFGQEGTYLQINRGSQIDAEGTANNPIVFTSYQKLIGEQTEAGQWGGIVLLGNAPTNQCSDLDNCSVTFEVGDGQYGGNNTEDSSGILKYVRVEYAGYLQSNEAELNGISFAGVGAGTEVDYVQVHANADDGVEFFGGNVVLHHVVLTDNQDDSFDWTGGYQGGAQFVYIKQADDIAQRAIEADNNSNDRNATPIADPLIANLTFLGSNSIDNVGPDADHSEGILLREGTRARLYNILLKGAARTGECFDVNHSATIANAENGDIVFRNSIIDCTEPFKAGVDDDGDAVFDTQAWFTTADFNNVVAASGLDGYEPMTGSPALANGYNVSELDAEYVATDYIGAFDGSNDWTEGWTTAIHDSTDEPTALQPLNSCPANTSNDPTMATAMNVDLVCQLTGTITDNTTLLAGSNVLYQITGGEVIIGGDNTDSATLTVQPGVTVFGVEADFLRVSRGSQLIAAGTEERPIIFTSQQDLLGQPTEAGQWGGIVLFGNAPTNDCADINNCSVGFEVGSGSYGGNNPDDSSGRLSYVVVKYAGYLQSNDSELNGISFAGVGRGTQVDHIQIHANADDGVEFFGGTVDLKYVVLSYNQDDSFDWTGGWQGRAQFVWVIHDDNGPGQRGIEADNNDDNNAATPLSSPMIANMTILGSNNVDVLPAGSDYSEGILLRAGTAGQFYNMVVKGKASTGQCVAVQTDESINHANDGSLKFENSIVDCSNVPFAGDTTGGFDTQTWFGTAAYNNLVGDAGLNADGVPQTGAAVLGSGQDVSQVDSWFDATDYMGALSADSDWRAGWTQELN